MKRVAHRGLYPVMERREVEAWIETTCRPWKKGPDGYRLHWRRDARARMVTLRVVVDERVDVPAIVIYADLFTRTGFELGSLLANNKSLSVGAIALDSEHLVLRHVLPLDTLTFSELQRALHVLALQATTLRQATTRDVDPRADIALFAHFAL